jgi:Ca-activated chloride channel homolog
MGKVVPVADLGWASGPHSHSPQDPDPDRPASLSVRILLTVMIVGVLVVVGGGTTWWIYSQKPAADAGRPLGPCPDTVLHVVAAPEIAPVVRAAARTLNADRDCGPVGVTAQEPAVTSVASEQPDVWIPSSSAWLRISLVGGVEAYRVQGGPIARSPIVLAGPSPVAGRYAKGDRTSWMQLMAAVAGHQVPAVTMPDPLHSSVGMLAVYAIQAAMATSTPDAGIAQLRALTLRSRLKDASADPAELLRRVAAQSDASAAAGDVGVFPVTEQQLTTYQRAGRGVPLTGAFPSDALIQADYPFAVATTTKQAALAEKLRAAITKPMLTEAGFRTYSMPHALDVPERSDKLLAPALQWAQYRTLDFQVLLLIDESGSMNKPATDKAGRATTKAGLLKQSGLAATQLLGDETKVGMWFFGTATPTSTPHLEKVPFGPIDAKVGGGSRRAAMASAIKGYKAPENAGTPLFKTILDAQAAMRTKVKPGAITLIILLTDGSDGESTYTMPKKTFLDRLAKSQDPAHRVPVIGVGFGPDADMAVLTDMAKVTDGKAIAAKDPADLASAMAKAFLAAHAPS